MMFAEYLNHALTACAHRRSMAGDTPAMPLTEAHSGGFFVAEESHDKRSMEGGTEKYFCSMLKNRLLSWVRKPAKAMLLAVGVPSNRRVTCFWGVK